MIWRVGPWSPLARDLPLSVPRQVTSGAGWEAEPAVSPDGSLIAYASNESGNSDIWLIDARGGTQIRLTDDPGSDQSPAWFPDGSALLFVSNRRGQADVWKIPRLGGPPILLLPDAQDPAISPDGSLLAFSRADASGEPRIAVVTIADPTSIRVLTGGADGLWSHRDPAWSPDGSTLIYAAFRDLWAISLTGGRGHRLTSQGEADSGPRWSAEGDYVYFSSSREGTLALWRVPVSGGTPERITMGTGPETEPSLSSDGLYLAYSTHVQEPDIVLLDLQTGLRRRIPGARLEIQPTLAPDRSSVVFVSNRWGGRHDLWIQDLREDEARGSPRRLTDHPGSTSSPAYSPDGKWIAYYRVVDQQRDIWIVPTSGGPPTRITDDPAPDTHPAWAPDGRAIAFSSGRGGSDRIWVVSVKNGRPDGEARVVTKGTSGDMAPVWSPDGERIAYIATSGSLSDVWIASSSGLDAPRRITSRAGADRVRWDRASGRLLVSGSWSGHEIVLRWVSPEGGTIQDPASAQVAWRDASDTDFDLSLDGRLLAFTEVDSRGDIWLLEAKGGSY